MNRCTWIGPWLFLLALPLGAGTASAQAERRPAVVPEFQRGYKAFEDSQWEEAADFMWQAAKKWPEDGENAKTYGRWFEPYLPRYYLGRALYELGCYAAALGHFDQSLLYRQPGTLKGAKSYVDNLRSYRQKCEDYIELGIEEDATVNCSQWELGERADATEVQEK